MASASGARRGYGARRAGGAGHARGPGGYARGLAGARYLLAVALLLAISAGATLVLMAVAINTQLPVAGRSPDRPVVASPFTTYSPELSSEHRERGYPVSGWSMLPG